MDRGWVVEDGFHQRAIRLVQAGAVVDDGAYDDIRAMLATIHAAGWTSLTQPL